MRLFVVLFLFAWVWIWMAAFGNGSSFSQENIDLTWGGDRVKILNNGDLLTLSLDKDSGSAFQSKHEYLFGNISMQIKLVPGNSAGTVTSYYLASKGSNWDEIDFEFLGNLSGQPYTVHTNVYTAGKGDREQQFRLWFDPTQDFHTYSFVWNPHFIIFYVDDTPIRQFKNMDSTRVPFPERQAMRVQSSIWNGDEWATRGGLIKTDWTKAPFTASYRDFSAEACIWPPSPSANYTCNSYSRRLGLDAPSLEKLVWVQKHYMIYNYCFDTKRFPQGLPPECAATIT